MNSPHHPSPPISQPEGPGGIDGPNLSGISDAPGFLVLDTRRCANILFVIAAILAVVGVSANIVIFQIAGSPEADIARIMHRFDLWYEPSLPAWFSSLVLFFDSVMLALIGLAKRNHAAKYSNHWLALGFIFLALAIDESVMFQELLGKLINWMVSTDGILPFPWVVLGFAFAFAVFNSYSGFLQQLPQRFALLFILAGCLYVGGAVGMEFVAGSVIEYYGVESIGHTMMQTIEETLEMVGAILFFYSLAEYWNCTYGEMRIETPNQRTPKRRSPQDVGYS